MTAPWDDFTDEAAELGKPPNKCGVEAMLNALGDEARAAVTAALKRPELTSASIRAALKARDVATPSPFTLNRHRRGDCRCSREETS